MTPPSLRELTWLIGRDVNRTLGGLASMELLRRTMGARGWMDEDGHALLVAVARLTPGTNILSYSLALGWLLRGTPGAAVALAAASIPASVLIAVISATLVQVDQLPLVRALIALGLLVATVLVLSAAWHLLRPYMKGTNAVRAGVIAMVAIGLMLAHVTPVRILLVAAVVGVIMAPSTAPAPPAPAQADR